MDGNLITPTTPPPVSPGDGLPPRVVSDMGVQAAPAIQPATLPTYPDVTPARPIGFTAPPATPVVSQMATATPVTLPVQATPLPQPRLADTPVLNNPVMPKRQFKVPGKMGILIGFMVFAVMISGAAALFNFGQQPGSGTSSRGVVVPEQDLGEEVTLPETPSLIEEGQVLIVNGDMRLQGSMDFNSGEFLGSLVQGPLTTNQTYTLPNASGTICLDVNNCNFVTVAQMTQLQAELGEVQVQASTPSQNLTAGSGISIIGEAIQNTGVLTLNGQSGAVALTAGTGVNVTGTTISNTGVVSLGGQTGALDLVSGPGISISGLTISNNGVTSVQGLAGNVIFTAGSGIDITGTAVSNTGVTALTGTANQISVSAATGGVTLSLPQNIATASSPTFAGLTLSGALTAPSITSASGLTVGSSSQALTLQGSTASLSVTNGANVATLTFVAPTSNVTYRLPVAGSGTYDVCTTAGNCVGVGGSVSTAGGTPDTIPKFTSANGIGDSSITDDGVTVTVNGDFDVTGVINGQLVSSDALFTGNVTVNLDLTVDGKITVDTIDTLGAMTIGNTGQTLLMQGSAVTLAATSGGITNSLVFTTPAGSNKTITLPNASGTVCLTTGNCAGVGGTGDILQGGNSFGSAMTIGTNDGFALNFETNGSTAMTILTNGNVGIGQTNPTERLYVNGGNVYVSHAEPSLVLDDTGAGISWGIRSLSTGDLTFRNNSDGTRFLTVQNDGDVGIGTTNPGSKLQVVGGDITVDGSGIGLATKEIKFAGYNAGIFSDGTNGNITLAVYGAGTNTGFRFVSNTSSTNPHDTGGTELLRITKTGLVGVGVTSPDAKLHVAGGNVLVDNTRAFQIKNNANTAINVLAMDGSNHLSLGSASGMGNLILSGGTGSVSVATSSGTAMTVLNGGNVGIGTTNPGTNKVEIQAGSSHATTLRLVSNNDTPSFLLGVRGASGNALVALSYGYSVADAGTVRVFNGATENIHLDAGGSSYITGGNVGIGTNTPGSRLHVSTAGATTYVQVDRVSGNAFFGMDSVGTALGNDSSVPIYFFVNGAEAMRIINGGNVGIGTTNPLRKVDIAGVGTAAGAGGILRVYSTNTAAQDVGSSIALGGSYTGTSTQDWVELAARKENAGVDQRGYFALTINNGGGTVEALRVSSNRAVSIGGFTSNSVGLTVKGAVSQSANLQEWQNSSSTALISVTAAGGISMSNSSNGLITGPFAGQINMYGSGGHLTLTAAGSNSVVATGTLGADTFVASNSIRTVPANTTAIIHANGTGFVPLAVRGVVSQTANLQEWQGSGGTPVAVVTAAGQIEVQAFSYSAPANGRTAVGTDGSNNSYFASGGGNIYLNPQAGITPTDRQIILAGSGTRINFNGGDGTITADNGAPTKLTVTNSSGAGAFTLVVKAAGSQSTTNLQEWQNSSGSALVRINGVGEMVNSGKIFADASIRVIPNNASNVALQVQGAASQSASLQEWMNSSSVAMLKVDATGNLLGANVATATTGTTEAVARTDVTTVTLIAAGSFANNDIIFINNAGQDYYTRIVSGGGTTTLTVSPAVSYDVSASVTKYTAQNIGATTTDYTTTANRLFQGYFLGGVVTGAGSTTLSDGKLLSSGQLTLSSTGTVFKNTSNSTTALRVQTASGVTLLNVDTSTNQVTLGTGSTGELSSWTTNSSNPLPAGKDYPEAVVVNGYMYVSGGFTTGGTNTNTVHYAKVNANGSVGAWTTNAVNMPSQRYAHAMFAANGYLYIAGGMASGVAQADIWYGKPNADGSISSWTTSTITLPVALAYHRAVVANGYVFVTGGINSSFATQSAVYSSKLNADGSISSWATLTAMPNTRWQHAATVANGYLYIVGGGGSPSGQSNSTVYYAKITNTGTITGGWSTSSNPMPVSRCLFSATAINGYLYFTGGMDGAGVIYNTTYYAKLNGDGSTGTWTQNTSNTPANRAGYAMTKNNGYLYIMGGEDNSSQAYTQIYYASTQRVNVGGSLDLVGLSNGNLAEGWSPMGGSITAGEGDFLGGLRVRDQATFLNSVSIDQSLTVNGSFTLRSGTNLATAFQIQNAAGTNLFVVDTVNSNYGFGTTSFGSGSGVLGIADATTVPTINPSGGGVLYSQSGRLKWRRSDGTIDTIGAGPTEFVLTAGDFLSGITGQGSPGEGGDASLSGIGSGWVSALYFDASANEAGTAWTSVIPADWTTFHVDFVWSNTSTGTGNVVWGCYLWGADDGEAFGSGYVNQTVTAAAASQGTVKITRVITSGSTSNVSGRPSMAYIYRSATDGADTLANDASLLAVIIRKAS